jgi:hypothetical protein
LDTKNDSYVETNYFYDQETGIGWKQVRYFSIARVRFSNGKDENAAHPNLDTRRDFSIFKATLKGENYAPTIPKVLLEYSVCDFCGVSPDEEKTDEYWPFLVDKFFPYAFTTQMIVKLEPYLSRENHVGRKALEWDKMSNFYKKDPKSKRNPWKNVPLICRDLKSARNKSKYALEKICPNVGPIFIGISKKRLSEILECRISVVLSLLDAKPKGKKTVLNGGEEEEDVESIIMDYKESSSYGLGTGENKCHNSKVVEVISEIASLKKYVLSSKDMANLLSTSLVLSRDGNECIPPTEEDVDAILISAFEKKILVYGYEKPESDWVFDKEYAPLFVMFYTQE